MSTVGEAVEYNKIAISDVKSILTQLLKTENTEISIKSVNAGCSNEKVEEIAKAYNNFENGTRTIIQQVEKMLEDVLNTVNEVDEGQ